jgi:CMP-N-acetylneuraminic acid synthetase
LTSPSAVALIPARQGSKRVPGKNIRPLRGHPTIAYTIAPAIESGVFDAVIVSTDSDETAAIARHYGAEVPFLRPAQFASDTSPDIEWIEYTLTELARRGRTWDAFSLLRPTSPFRTADTIRRAWMLFTSQNGADSLRHSAT